MIELSAEDFARHLGNDPYGTPTDVTQNPEDYGAPYDTMIGQLRQQTELLTRLVLFSDTERTKRKVHLPLTTSAFNTTVEYKTSYLVLFATGATVISLTIGSTIVLNVPFGTGDTKIIPFYTVIGRGNDVFLSATGGVTASGYFVADNN